MFCIQCGKENLETAHYCAKCGASMAESLQNPTVPPKAKKSAGVLESIGNQIANFASTEKLEGFSLREFFSEVLKKRESSEIDEYFVVGTPRTTRPSRMFRPTGRSPGSFSAYLLSWA